jgi:hypothetical protein
MDNSFMVKADTFTLPDRSEKEELMTNALLSNFASYAASQTGKGLEPSIHKPNNVLITPKYDVEGEFRGWTVVFHFGKMKITFHLREYQDLFATPFDTSFRFSDSFQISARFLSELETIFGEILWHSVREANSFLLRTKAVKKQKGA